jgi:hypothetical protein
VGQTAGLEALKNRNVFGRPTSSKVTTLTDADYLSSYKLFCTLNCKNSFLWRSDLLHNFYEVNLRQTVGDGGSIKVKQQAYFRHPTEQRVLSLISYLMEIF